MSLDRLVWICETCLSTAHHGGPREVTDILNQMTELVKQISSVTIIKSEEIQKIVADIMWAILPSHNIYLLGRDFLGFLDP